MKSFLVIYQYVLMCGVSIIAHPSSAQQVLSDYIQQGLTTNQSIKAQEFLLEKSVYALQEARSLFLPNITFFTSYTRANGGRTIDVPVGDLLNKAYTTLNTLTATSNFPQLQNQHIQLNPDNFYDAKFRASMPLLNAELSYNRKIKQQQKDLQHAEVLVYKRELVKEIKKSYYLFAKASNAVSIYQSSMILVKENNRINTALFNNEKINRTSVIRSENEVSKINAQLIAAEQNKKSARAYFNFLLNRPLADSISLDTTMILPVMQVSDSSVAMREELLKLKLAIEINDNMEGVARSYLVPKINTFVDLGSQAFDFKLNGDSRYYLLGLTLEWNIFSFGKNIAKIKQAAAARQSLLVENSYTENQLRTQLSIAQNDFENALAQYDASREQLQSADRYYLDELRLYKEGKAIYIELLDAQNQLINASLESNSSLFDAWIRYADIERATASFTLN